MKKNYPCTERDKSIVLAVYKLLGNCRGKNHRISRNDLRFGVASELEMSFADISDRDVRLAIEYLRNETVQGSLILSTSGSAGYWVAESFSELTQYADEDRRRALSILVRIHKQKKVARSHFIDQENLPLFDFANSINSIEDSELAGKSFFDTDECKNIKAEIDKKGYSTELMEKQQMQKSLFIHEH